MLRSRVELRVIQVLTLAGTGGRADATPLPKVFRGYRQNALTDLAEIVHSFAAILFTPISKNFMVGSGQVTEL